MKHDVARLKESFRLRLGKEALQVEAIAGGANSRACKVLAPDGGEYFAKFYLTARADKRPRLATEFRSLQWMWKHGIRSVPEPFFCDEKRQLAVYAFLPGAKCLPGEIGQGEIEEAVSFLGDLQKLKKFAGESPVPRASEACFSIQEYVRNLDGRVAKLKASRDAALKCFLRNSLVPWWERLRAYTHDLSLDLNIPWPKTLGPAERALSPSDVGFHNILKNAEGKLSFIDFEYFGWDDPVKTISDLLLHPEIPVPPGLRVFAIREFLKRFPRREELTARFRLVYPLLAMRWCLIILNRHLPGRSARAPKGELDRQLEKAKQKLETVKTNITARDYIHWLE